MIQRTRPGPFDPKRKEKRIMTLLRRIVVGMMLILAALAFSVAAVDAKDDDRPTIAWSPQKVEATVGAGTSTNILSTMTTSRRLRNVTFRVVPAIDPFVDVTPSSVSQLSAGQSTIVTLAISVPASTSLGTYHGTIHVLSKGKKVGKPLPVILHVGEALGSGGGTVTDSTGTVSLEVPEGAVGTTTVFTIEPSASAPPSSVGTVIGQTVDFGPNGITFDKLVTVNFAYDESQLPLGTNENELVIVHETASGWQSVPTSVDASGNVASAQARHFTRFALVKPGATLKLAAPTVSPSTGPQGTDFAVNASGFTPTGTVTLVLVRPDKSYALQSVTADGSGNVSAVVDSTGFAAGDYDVWFEEESSGKHTAKSSFAVTSAPSTTVVVDTFGGTEEIGDMGITAVPRRAQSFTMPSGTFALTVRLKLATSGNLPTDGVVVTLHTDAAGVPDESSILAISNTVSASTLPVFTDSFATIEFDLPAVSITSGQYWIVVARTGSPDDSKHYVMTFRSDDPFAGGAMAGFVSSTAEWVVVPSYDFAAQIESTP